MPRGVASSTHSGVTPTPNPLCIGHFQCGGGGRSGRGAQPPPPAPHMNCSRAPSAANPPPKRTTGAPCSSEATQWPQSVEGCARETGQKRGVRDPMLHVTVLWALRLQVSVLTPPPHPVGGGGCCSTAMWTWRALPLGGGGPVWPSPPGEPLDSPERNTCAVRAGRVFSTCVDNIFSPLVLFFFCTSRLPLQSHGGEPKDVLHQPQYEEDVFQSLLMNIFLAMSDGWQASLVGPGPMPES